MSKGMKVLVGLLVIGMAGLALGPTEPTGGTATSGSVGGTTPAPRARTRPPVSGPARTVEQTIVWKSEDAASEGIKLITAGVHKSNPEALVPLVSCFLEPGVNVTSIGTAGMMQREVIVDEGPQRGCRGITALEHVGPR